MHSLLKRSLLLSNKIERLAEQLDWKALLCHSQQRDECIKKYFKLNQKLKLDKTETIAKVITDIKKSDERTSTLIENNKKYLVGESLSLKNNLKAIKQYSLTLAG